MPPNLDDLAAQLTDLGWKLSTDPITGHRSVSMHPNNYGRQIIHLRETPVIVGDACLVMFQALDLIRQWQSGARPEPVGAETVTLEEAKETAMTELKDLVGAHVLSGVDRFNEATVDGDAETISFCLDGVTYTVAEDPDDGYRSSHKAIEVSDIKLTNTFPPVPVLCVHDDGGDRETHDVLRVLNAATAAEILHVGTENTDDYYPCFVAQYDPAALAGGVK